MYSSVLKVTVHLESWLGLWIEGGGGGGGVNTYIQNALKQRSRSVLVLRE